MQKQKWKHTLLFMLLFLLVTSLYDVPINAETKTYQDQQSVVNLTDKQDDVVELTAQWSAGTVTLPTPTRVGYTFGGWYKEKACTNFIGNGGSSYTPNSSQITMFAKWIPVNYTVKFNPNGGSGTMLNQSFTFDKTDNLSANKFTYAHHTFKNWNTKSNGTGTSYANKAGVTNLSSTNGATVNLYAQWNENVYKITLDNQGADINPGSSEFYEKYGVNFYENEACTQTIQAIIMPEKTGYNFMGYCAGIDGAGQGYIDEQAEIRVAFDTFKSDTTIYADWDPITYTIRFDGNGATSGTMADMAMTYKESDNLTKNTYVKDKYLFNGWNTKADGSGTPYSDMQEVINLSSVQSSVITMYAQWVEDEYTVHYNANGGTGTMSSEVFNFDTEYSLKENTFTKVGYQFKGWSTSATGTVVYQDKQRVKNIATGSSITLYAVWEAEDVPYKVNHYTENLDGTYELHSTDAKTGKADSLVTCSSYKKNITGFTYKEAKVGTVVENDDTVAIAPNGTLVIDLYYTRNEYIITLNKGTGISSVSGAGTYKFDDSVTISATVTTGYSWKNWTGTFTEANRSYTFKMPANDITLKANANPNVYEITLDNNGADTAGTKAYYERYADANYTTDGCTTTISKITVPTRTGYTFKGYYLNNTQYVKADGTITSTATTFTADTTLVAKWDINSYTVTLNKDAGISSVSGAGTYDYKDQVTITATVATGYSWKNWTGTSTQSSISYTFNMPANDVTFTANTTPNVYEITLNNQGADTTGTKAYFERYADANYTTDGCTTTISKITIPTWTGKTFKGYFTGQNGAGTQYVKADGTITSTATTFTADTELFAHWENIDYTVTLNKGIGISSVSGGGTYNYGDSITVKATVATGYSWKNWTGDKSSTDIVYTFNMPANNVTLTANAEPNVYKITLDNQSADTTGTKAYYERYADANYTSSSCATAITSITVPTRVGYTFKGYYTGQNGTGTQYVKADGTITSTATTFTADTTLYAYWTINSYTVTLNKGTGISNVSGAGSYNYGSSVTITATVATGYSWKNWTGDKSSTDIVYTFNMPANNVTLTANAEPNVYKITLDNQNADTTGTKAYYERYADANYTSSSCATAITSITVPTRIGYTFKGYYTGQNGAGTQYVKADGTITSTATTFTADTTLYAYWTPNVYKITLDNQGADTAGTTAYYERYADAQYTTSSCATKITKITIPTLNGYTFKGYYTGQNGAGSQYIKSDGTLQNTDGTTPQNATTFTADTTLYAYWIPNVYKITLDNKIPLDSNGSIPSNASTGTTEYYQKWDVNQYKSYNASTGVCSTVITKIDIPVRPGYLFQGYWTEDNDSTTSNGYKLVNDDGTLQNANGSTPQSATTYSSDTTLYAKWKPNMYYIKFDANNPNTKNDITGTMANQTVYFDVAFDLNQNQYQKPGYTFLKWTLTATKDLTAANNTSSKGWSDKGRVSENLATNANDIVTVYAQWVPNIYTVTFDANDNYTETGKYAISSATLSKTSINVTYDSQYGTLPTATRPGYTFVGWFDAANGGNQITATSSYETPNNITLYAHWENLNPDSVTLKALANGTGNGNLSYAASSSAVTSKWSNKNFTITVDAKDVGDGIKTIAVTSFANKTITPVTTVTGQNIGTYSTEGTHTLTAKVTDAEANATGRKDGSSDVDGSITSSGLTLKIDKTAPKVNSFTVTLGTYASPLDSTYAKTWGDGFFKVYNSKAYGSKLSYDLTDANPSLSTPSDVSNIKYAWVRVSNTNDTSVYKDYVIINDGSNLLSKTGDIIIDTIRDFPDMMNLTYTLHVVDNAGNEKTTSITSNRGIEIETHIVRKTVPDDPSIVLQPNEFMAGYRGTLYIYTTGWVDDATMLWPDEIVKSSLFDAGLIDKNGNPLPTMVYNHLVGTPTITQNEPIDMNKATNASTKLTYQEANNADNIGFVRCYEFDFWIPLYITHESNPDRVTLDANGNATLIVQSEALKDGLSATDNSDATIIIGKGSAIDEFRSSILN